MKAPRGVRAPTAAEGGHRGPVMAHKQIYYSDKYDDEEFEYRYGARKGPSNICLIRMQGFWLTFTGMREGNASIM